MRSVEVENRSNPSYFLPIYKPVQYDSKAHRGLYKAAWFSSPWKAIYPTIFVSLFLIKASIPIMAEVGDENELLDYEEEETETAAEAQATNDLKKKDVKGTYVSIHSSGFRDFLLKPELLRAIVDCGFEHPSEGTRADLSFCQVLRSKILSLPSCICFLSLKCFYFLVVVSSSQKILSIYKDLFHVFAF